MSLAKVRKAVDEFLSTNNPETLSIKGSWGVGKTYFWNETIKAASKKDEFSFKRYAYISLFGVTSLDELKFTIFEQAVDSALIGEKVSIDTLKKNTEELTEKLGRKVVQFLPSLPWLKNFGTAIQSASFMSVKDMLICFDDFERKGDSLSAKDILGLVSLLKEQRDCKVILIFNDTNLDEKSLDVYRQFREKVIDVEVVFSPDPKEAAEIVFDGQSASDIRLKALSTQLGIKNIRILNKIKRAVGSVDPLLNGYEQEVIDQIYHTLTLMAWSYYSPDEDTPTFEYVKNIGYGLYGLGDNKEKTKQEEKWDAILREYNFLHLDEFDLELANVIESGYVDNETLIGKAKAQNEQILANKSQNSFNSAWDLYHNSFDDDEEELLDTLGTSLIENACHVSPMNMNATIRLFRQLDRSKEASELITKYIEANKDRKGLFDLDEYAFANDIDDPEVISKFNQQLSAQKEIKSAKDVLNRIAGKNGWGSSDEEVLANTTEDELFNIFKKQKDKQLSKYVDTCLQFGRFSNSTERQKKIADKAKSALLRIGKENRLNAIRVRKFGINVDKESGD